MDIFSLRQYKKTVKFVTTINAKLVNYTFFTM